MLRRWLRGLALVVAGCGLVWGLLEIVVAVAPPRGIYVYDAEMGFRVRPFAVWGEWRANALGCNDRERVEAKPAETFRVLVLGDSFNWAGGLDGNYTRLLEYRLAARMASPRVEVLNMGFPGTHTAEQLTLLRREGMRFQPDLVILGVVVGNDFEEAQSWRRVVPLGGQLTPLDLRREPLIVIGGVPFTTHSHVGRFLAGRLTLLRLRLAALADGTDVAAKGVTLPDAAFHALERERMAVAEEPPSDVIRAGEATVFASIAAMRELVDAAGGRLVVAAYPEPFQLDAGLRTRILAQASADIARFEWDRPQRRLAEECRALGIEYVDFLPAFRAAPDGGLALYLRNEPHWNPAGQSLAADLLLPVVLRHAGARPADR